MKYGQAPQVIGEFLLEPSEMCLVQYLPIIIPGVGMSVPENLEWVSPMFASIEVDMDDYVYLTVKNVYESDGKCSNRPGWHSDGFGTDDINYIWCDRCPTEFAVQDFLLSADCIDSLREMDEQVRKEGITTYPINHLLRLDQSVIHRSPEHFQAGMRAFVKISVSKNKYNLKGNAHNYGLDYQWVMHERGVERNHPTK